MCFGLRRFKILGLRLSKGEINFKSFGKLNPKYHKRNISSRVIIHGIVFNYFANFSSLLKSVPAASDVSRDIFVRPIAVVTPLMGPGESPGEVPGWAKPA